MAFQPSTAQILPFPQQEDEGVRFVPATGKWEEDQPDGSVLIYDQDPATIGHTDEEDDEHGENIAELLSDEVLAAIAIDVIEGIEEDDRSRADWLAMRSKAIDLLGLKIEEPKGDVANGPAGEGMATVRHPLFLEASVRFQANARGELLPSDGPVKVKNSGQGTSDREAAGVALEEATNVYLTDTATEYYPDTDKLLFQAGCFGAGFKKGYHCPIRRRPVIESIDAKDLIVSNTATDIDSAPRLTHVIKMSPSTMIRMQLAGAYREVDLAIPDEDNTELDTKIATTQGVSKSSTRPQDTDYTVLECHCDYDIPGFEHEVDGEKTGLPLPYKIVIDKTSREILEIRRNWREGDESLRKRRSFVMYPFVPMFGFYPYGLLHLLGNTTRAITAAWRIILDNGMFNNFSAFLYAKGAANNETPNFKVGPGQGVGIDCPQGKLSDSVMPFPFKETSPAFMQFIDAVAQTGQRLGGTAEAQIGEGNQQAPVGTTLAMIDQAQKIMSAVHKRIHSAQALELKMLKELLQEDPEALWRHREDGSRPWNADMIVQALNDYDLIPVADPNTPTHMHRLMKTAALAQRADTHPERYDAVAVETEVLRGLGWDNPSQFFVKVDPNAQPAEVAPDPHVMGVMANAASTKLKVEASNQAAMLRAQSDEANRQVKMADIQQRAADAEANRQARKQEKILDITHSLAVHPASMGEFNNPGQAQ